LKAANGETPSLSTPKFVNKNVLKSQKLVDKMKHTIQKHVDFFEI